MEAIGSEILILLVLILLNGMFAMAEMAVVSSRRSRLQQKAEDGERGAKSALELAENPNRFLSTVQVGITLIGILSGAFGGATLAEEIGKALSAIPPLAPYGEGIGIAVVVAAVTYFSLVLGELAPKRLAMNNPEGLALFLAPLMRLLSTLSAPLVALLGASTNFLLRVLRMRPPAEPAITEDDLRSMLDEGTQVGVFEEMQQELVERVLRLGDRSAATLITPRPDVVFLDVNASQDEILERIRKHPFFRFPVIQGTADNVLGVVRVRDLLLQQVTEGRIDLRGALQPALYIPENAAALDVLQQFKQQGMEIAIVIDEFGGVMGLTSMTDILEAIVGDVPSPGEAYESEALQREDGSWLFDGMLAVGDLKDYLNLDELPDEEEGRYETLGGMLMAVLGHIPSSGDHLHWEGYRFEVVDMDGRRVDKVLVEKTGGQEAA